ncbi:MAG: MBL fold metallo-hydrolase [Dehalococcoidia bacterium]|nr:MBL fold metallo-hydrolase [Dehalococcoidia bacterium]
MIEELLPGIFKLAIPLPRSPLKATNSYVVTTGDRPLVIDTAFNRPECRESFVELLGELAITPDSADYFITHLHADHAGLAPSIAGDDSVIYFNEQDLPLARPTDSYWDWMAKMYESHGMPLSDSAIAMERHPGRIYGPAVDFPYTVIHHGDRLKTGQYTLRCVQTTGHTPGHMCLLLEEANMLFCGDHILGDITPNITMWWEMKDPLGDYLKSLDATALLKPVRAFPGHRSIIEDCAFRIEELKRHHTTRLEEVLEALKDGEKDAAAVTPLISWDLRYEQWDDVHPIQKLFATGEALAHLQHLEAQRMVNTREEHGRILYRLAGS